MTHKFLAYVYNRCIKLTVAVWGSNFHSPLPSILKILNFQPSIENAVYKRVLKCCCA